MKPEHPKTHDIPALRQLWQEAFVDPAAFLDAFFTTAYSPERCVCIIDGDRVCSAAYWIDVDLEDGKGAYIYAVATAKDYRGQGLAHAVMQAVREELVKKDYAAAILVPGEPSLAQFYEAMGYRFFGGIHSISAIAKSPGAKLRTVDGDEYAALRKKYLPKGAVLQERENMQFLERYAGLYAGEDFLLAAYVEGDIVSGLELLGNGENAPHILKALGAEQGSFRTPGAEPFAMWLPLKKCQEPAYFGIAFD